MRKVAPFLGLIDQPDTRRKLHETPIPVSGGIAIFLAATTVLFGFQWFSEKWSLLLHEHLQPILTLASGALLLVIVGTLDDRFSLNGITKLIGQVASASVVVFGGLSIETISLFGYEFSLGMYAFPFAVFWLVGTINAMNLLDGLDGMAGMIGLTIVLTIGIGSQISHRFHVVLLSFVFCSCLLGFLIHNLPPARIFLGDSGSMLIGLVGGALAIMGSHKSTGAVLFAVPVALLTIPILDSSAAFLRRKLTGRSIFATDRNHLHHRLMNKLGCNWKVLFLVMVICFATSMVALASRIMQNDWISIAGVGTIVVALIVTDTFGLHEIRLIARSFPSRIFVQREPDSKSDVGRTFHLQGIRPWDFVWRELLLTAKEKGARGVRLDISMPLEHEEFIANWNDGCIDDKDRCNEFKLTLELHSRWIGKLELLFPPEAFASKREMLNAITEIDLLCERHIVSLFEIRKAA
jgi:UDP-GlcNAc:undecaprenyl-phosphate GlcNAc-1-phosphate transferase